MPIAGIRVLTIGNKKPNLPYVHEHCDRVQDLMSHIARLDPDVIVSFGFMPGILHVADFEIRKRWIHPADGAPDVELQNAIENCYRFNIHHKHQYQDANPLVSVYTGSFNTGDLIRDTYRSLAEQTYSSWEWVVVDDGSTDGTWEYLMQISHEDHRVRPFRMKHNGRIGAVKDTATRLANGAYLIELDHDDMLTEDAVEEVKKAFDSDDSIGMVYSNCINLMPDGSSHTFDDDFWKERYKEITYRGKKYLECNIPNIYDRFGPHHTQQFGWFLTVGPHHLRSFRASTLKGLGGYNRHLPIADDWDLFTRFFLRSKCHKIDKCLYIYRYLDNWQNATFTRNKAIQDHLAIGRGYYEEEFKRFNLVRLAADKLKREGLKWQVHDVSVVIVDAGTPELTKSAVASVKSFAPKAEIIVVRNGSTDPIGNCDQEIELPYNLGFAAACNFGASKASRMLVLFMNSDAEFVDSKSIEQMITELEDSSIGAVGPYSNVATSPQGNIEQSDNLPQVDVEFVSGFCMLVRKNHFMLAGGFDTRLSRGEVDMELSHV